MARALSLVFKRLFRRAALFLEIEPLLEARSKREVAKRESSLASGKLAAMARVAVRTAVLEPERCSWLTISLCSLTRTRFLADLISGINMCLP